MNYIVDNLSRNGYVFLQHSLLTFSRRESVLRTFGFVSNSGVINTYFLRHIDKRIIQPQNNKRKERARQKNLTITSRADGGVAPGFNVVVGRSVPRRPVNIKQIYLERRWLPGFGANDTDKRAYKDIS